MSIGTITGFSLPFDKITLDDVSQKILIQLVSLLKDLSIEDLKIALCINNEKLIRSGIDELIDKKYVKLQKFNGNLSAEAVSFTYGEEKIKTLERQLFYQNK